MGTSVDRGTHDSKKPGWKQTRRIGSIILGLVVLCLITAGAIGCNEQVSKDGGLPEIVSFQANPPINEGDPVSYTFEVKNATKISLIEAGDTIKEIAGPSSGIYEGAATGQASSAVLTSDNKTFDAVLEASNEQGTVKKTATLSGSAVLKSQPYNQYGDRPCPTGCGCSAPPLGMVLTPCTSGCSGPIECQSLLANIDYKKYCYKIPCQCYGWTSENVSWSGSSPGSQITSCGAGPVEIGWIYPGTDVKILTLQLCGNCSDNYSWSVTKVGGTEGPWYGNTLPVIFAPLHGGQFEVVQNLSCGDII
jgi:hypothetical protein